MPPVAVMLQGVVYYWGMKVMEKKHTLSTTEQLKHILLEAYRYGEVATHMTAKDMVQQLIERLKQTRIIS
jgi:tRNA A37 N6-isopentenylltransferase MiaA